MKPRIIGMKPWAAAGPGWANQGITYITEDDVGKRETHTVYVNDLRTNEAVVAFRIALTVYGTLLNECLAHLGLEEE